MRPSSGSTLYIGVYETTRCRSKEDTECRRKVKSYAVKPVCNGTAMERTFPLQAGSL